MKPFWSSIPASAASPSIGRSRRCGPHADFIYVADDAAFPYGAIAEPALVTRVVGLIGELIAAHRPDLVVIACNTASTIVLPDLRKTFALPFVGTVPAIKPACAASVTRRVSVLGTEATVAREYTRALIRDYAQDCQVTLVGSKQLAAYAEAELAGAPVERRRKSARKSRPASAMTASAPTPSCWPARIIRCCSTGCQRLAPWPVNFLDPAPAIARRVVDLLGPGAGIGRRPDCSRHLHLRPRAQRQCWRGSAFAAVAASTAACRSRVTACTQFSAVRALPLALPAALRFVAGHWGTPDWGIRT